MLRRSKSKRLSRYSKSSVGSGYLNPESDIFDNDNPLWWKNLETQTTLRPSTEITSPHYTSACLNSHSDIESTEVTQEWWRVLETPSGSLKHSKNTLRKSNIGSYKTVMESSSSDNEENIIVRKRKVPFRVKPRESKEKNAFLEVLENNSSIRDQSQSMQDKSTKHLESFLQPLVTPSSQKIDDVSDSSNQMNNTNNILKLKPQIFKRKRISKNESIFNDVLKPQDNLSTVSTERMDNVENSSEKLTNTNDILKLKPQIFKKKRLSKNESIFNDVLKPQDNLSTVSTEKMDNVENSCEKLTNTNDILKLKPQDNLSTVSTEKVDDAANSSEKLINTNDILKLKSHISKKKRSSKNKNIIDNVLKSQDNSATISTIFDNNVNESEPRKQLSTGVSNKSNVDNSDGRLEDFMTSEVKRLQSKFLKRCRKSFSSNIFENILMQEENGDSKEKNIDPKSISIINAVNNDMAEDSTAKSDSHKILSTNGTKKLIETGDKNYTPTQVLVSKSKISNHRQKVSKSMNRADSSNNSSNVDLSQIEPDVDVMNENNHLTLEPVSNIESKDRSRNDTDGLPSRNSFILKQHTCNKVVSKSMPLRKSDRILRSHASSKTQVHSLPQYLSESVKRKNKASLTKQDNSNITTSENVDNVAVQELTVPAADTEQPENNLNIKSKDTKHSKETGFYEMKENLNNNQSQKSISSEGMLNKSMMNELDIIIVNNILKIGNMCCTKISEQELNNEDNTKGIPQNKDERQVNIKKKSSTSKEDVHEMIQNSRGITKPSTSKTQKTIDSFFKIKDIRNFKLKDSSIPDDIGNSEEMKKVKKKMRRIRKHEMDLLKVNKFYGNENVLLKRKETNLNEIRRNLHKISHTSKKKEIDKAYLVNGEVYKKPKLPRPKYWATNRLYSYLWKCMEPKYKATTKVHSERFVQQLASVVTIIMRKKQYKNYQSELNALMKEMARLGIILTRNDFYDFCYEFLPYEFRVKVVPMLLPGNIELIPYDPETLHTPILEK